MGTASSTTMVSKLASGACDFKSRGEGSVQFECCFALPAFH